MSESPQNVLEWIVRETESAESDDSETLWLLADDQLAALAAAGYAVVPVEPTKEMCRRGAAMFHDTQMASGHPERGGKFSDFELPAAEAWRAMIKLATP